MNVSLRTRGPRPANNSKRCRGAECHSEPRARPDLRPALLTLIVGAGLFATTAPAVGSSPAAAACKPGPTTIHGQPAEVFCGPARASVHVGGKTLQFAGGKCTKAFSALIVNIGTEVITRATVQTQPYFAAAFPFKHGKGSKTPTVSWASGHNHGTTALVAHQGPLVKYTLSKGRNSATFSGVTYPAKQRFSGKFTC